MFCETLSVAYSKDLASDFSSKSRQSNTGICSVQKLRVDSYDSATIFLLF
jgi:hypothetical protein